MSRRKGALWAILAIGMVSNGPQALAQDSNGPAFGNFGGSLKVSTDYRFRGISNSNNGPQIQGDLNWSHPIGVYTGVWASNTDFGGAGNSMEIDPYIGFARSIGDTGLSYDLGFWSYNYPRSQSDFDYWEIYAIGTYSIGRFSISPSVWYADNYFGEDFLDGVSGLAYEGTVAWQLPMGFEISARVGEQTFGSGGEGLDYVYYDAGISKDWGNFTFDVRWVDTDGVQPALANPDLAEGEVVASITRHF